MTKFTRRTRNGIAALIAAAPLVLAPVLESAGADSPPRPPRSRLLKTGQTRCFDAGGSPVNCAGTGQDGEFQAGADREFVDNGDGTITDVATGLMWEKQSSDGSVHDVSHHDRLDAAKIAELVAEEFAGYNDWRLPNVRELESLQEFARSGHAVVAEFDGECTPGCTVQTCSCIARPYFYHSSSTQEAVPYKAWDVGFRYGFVSPIENYSDQPIRAVRTIPGAHPRSRPLRTGQLRCFSRNLWDAEEIPCAGTNQDGEIRAGARRTFTDNGDGTVTDNTTSLVWEKLSYDGSIHQYDAQYTWTEALRGKIAELNAMQFAGHSDWRLPNIRELSSLRTIGSANPAVYRPFHRGCTPGCDAASCSCTPVTGNHWSSTTYPARKIQAWTMWFPAGHQVPLVKEATGFVRAVRGGL